MFDNGCMSIQRTKAAQLTEEEVEKIDNWCDEFRVFFGWKVKADYHCARAVFEVIGKRFNYHMLAQDKDLGTVVQNKNSRQICQLLTGGLNFHTFARIMIEVVRLESAGRKTSENVDKTGDFSLV